MNNYNSLEEAAQMKQTVCFTGHRPHQLPWHDNIYDKSCIAFKLKLHTILEDLMRKDYSRFMTGMAIGADMVCATVVISMRIKYPHIQLEAACPYRGVYRHWSAEQKGLYNDILSRADQVTYISERYTNDSVYMQRNEYMVKESELVIGIYRGTAGGTRNTLIHAARKHKRIMIINPVDLSVSEY